MDFERFSEKVRSLLQKAQTLASRSKQQSLEPEHLLKVMLEDEDGTSTSLVATPFPLTTIIIPPTGKFPRGYTADMIASDGHIKTMLLTYQFEWELLDNLLLRHCRSAHKNQTPNNKTSRNLHRRYERLPK